MSLQLPEPANVRHISRTFMPKGDRYTADDFERIASLFPITYGDIPWCPIDLRVFPGYIPPFVYLGWYIPEHRAGVVNMAKKHFQDMLILKDGRKKSDRFIFSDFPKFIIKHYQVPEKFQHKVDIVDVTMKDADGLAVVIGSNMKGWLSEDLVMRISDNLFDGEQSCWHLHRYRWNFTQARHSYDPSARRPL